MKTKKKCLKRYKNICKSFKSSINFENAALYYKTSTVFHLPTLTDFSSRYIERFFTTIAASEGFLELDFERVKKLLSSSMLHVDSELEVLNSAERWARHGTGKRGVFSKQLLLKARLALLSDHALRHLLKTSPLVCNDEECKAVVLNFLSKNILEYQTSFSKFSISRHCYQRKFDVVVCGGQYLNSKVLNDVLAITFDKPKSFKIAQMTRERFVAEAVCVSGDLYVFGGLNGNYNLARSVVKYSPRTNCWTKVCNGYDRRHLFSACSFTDKVFLMGGFQLEQWTANPSISSCLQFDTRPRESRTWKEVAAMDQDRMCSASAVFKGRVVVSGGYTRYQNQGIRRLNTVEAYDHVADAWTYMPNMVHSRQWHSLVAMGNKLFVIGGKERACEVYDSTTGFFVLIRKCPNFFVDSYTSAVAIGHKIVVVGDPNEKSLFYDTKTNSWTETPFEHAQKVGMFCCAKLPQL